MGYLWERISSSASRRSGSILPTRNYNTFKHAEGIGGATPTCLELGAELYSRVRNEGCAGLVHEGAEMSKLLENTFRSINIAFINEMAMMCDG